MRALKVAVCDDNAEERAFLCDVCKTVKENKNIQIRLKEYDSGDALLFDMEDARIVSTVDIVLLDINMPGKKGIDTARTLRQYGYQGAIIFITKSNAHWRGAFDVKAFNYITKDDDLKDRFVNVFWDAVEEAENRRGKTLLLSSVGEMRQVDINAISHFEVEQYVVRVYYNANENFTFISSLAKIENLLFGNSDFVRVHRSFLISVTHVAKVDKNTVEMLNGMVIPISRRHHAALRDAIAGTRDRG